MNHSVKEQIPPTACMTHSMAKDDDDLRSPLRTGETRRLRKDKRFQKEPSPPAKKPSSPPAKKAPSPPAKKVQQRPPPKKVPSPPPKKVQQCPPPKKAPLKQNRKNKQKVDEVEIDKDGFPIYDLSEFVVPVPDWFGVEDIWFEGPATILNFSDKVSPYNAKWLRVLPDSKQALELRSSFFEHLNEKQYEE